MRRRRYRRRRTTRASRRVYALFAAAALVTWAWTYHPVYLITAVVVVVVVAVGRWRWRRRALAAPGGRTWVYRHFDRSGQLLYVGITNNYRLRCEQHADDKHWWWRVDPGRSTTQVFPNRTAALLAEEQAIRVELPLFNVVHNRRPVGWSIPEREVA